MKYPFYISNFFGRMFLLLCLCFLFVSSAYSQYTGGGYDGFSIKQKLSCPDAGGAALSNIYLGGGYDGFSIKSFICPSATGTVPFVGGSYDGFSIKNSFACPPPAPPALVNISLGGGYDGFSIQSRITCPSSSTSALENIYLGGVYDGFSIKTSLICPPPAPPVLTNIYLGGNYDGFSINSKVPCAVAGAVPFMGGVYDGFSNKTSFVCPSPAPPALTNIYLGGAYDGFSNNRIACPYMPPPVVITLVNISLGGSYDGFSNGNKPCLYDIFVGGASDGFSINTDSCPPPILPPPPILLAKIYYGGSSDGFSIISINCPSATGTVPYTGGAYDGFSVNRLSCPPVLSPLANIYLGGNYNGFSNNKTAPCPPSSGTALAGIYLGGSYDGFSINTINNCVPVVPASTNIFLGGSYQGFSLKSIDCPIVAGAVPYLGGKNDGFSIKTSYYCPPPLPPPMINIFKGGIRQGAFVNTVFCALVSPPTLAGIYLGGMYDGVSMSKKACPLVGLPIELLRFTATLLSNRQVLCKWETESEINNDYFTVEKTKDGISYEEVGKIKGAGNSSMTLDYFMVDENPYKGTSYYRLNQTDYDGKSKYSHLEAITLSGGVVILSNGLIINAYPNPVTEELTIYTFAEKELTAIVEISDILGRRVFYKTQLFEKNSIAGNKFFINTSYLREGMYLLSIRDAATNKTLHIQRIVKLGY